MPDEATEKADPDEADKKYATAIDWLKEATRTADFPLILKENTEYGFRRNLLGLKNFALLTNIVAIIFLLILAYLEFQIGLNTDEFNALILFTFLKNFSTNKIALLLYLEIVILIAICMIVQVEWVKEAANDYTKRLLSACDGLAIPKK